MDQRSPPPISELHGSVGSEIHNRLGVDKEISEMGFKVDYKGQSR